MAQSDLIKAMWWVITWDDYFHSSGITDKNKEDRALTKRRKAMGRLRTLFYASGHFWMDK